MVLTSGASLAEAPDLSPQQLERLTRSVERKKQRLEADIAEYIRRKQADLHSYERELIQQCRSMESSSPSSDNGQTTSKHPMHSGVENASSSSEAKDTTSEAEVSSKRSKHTRVQKREKELCGFVTPLYLPLLEAHDHPPAKKRKDKMRHAAEKGAETTSSSSSSTMNGASPLKDAQKGEENRKPQSKAPVGTLERPGSSREDSDATTADENAGPLKKRRSALRKSSLRGQNSSKLRRKRVSIVIDDQIVLPADNIDENAVLSPSENSNASTPMGDMPIDPLLTDYHSHQDPVHHSLPYPILHPSSALNGGPGPTLEETSPVEPGPPQTETQTYLDPSPPPQAPTLPFNASASPIFPNVLETAAAEEEKKFASSDDQRRGFKTYVGGLSGSGVDNVDQSGSYGYPSSLGASYLESYMKSRPLTVRMQAADKAELDEEEKRALMGDGEDEEMGGVDIAQGERESAGDRRRAHGQDDDDEMDVIGSMEGF
ncbi:hypothetical protein M011DRAFT_103408 [Sporormia fimetaria CBS 119925]|uniref:Uncharacterized protein n=1 Tax=Sporormia fimetaria CBS 119925 TaxID=1340428 RepID=A0A6A6VKM3_9PLEO|nr:hypothetical protein M011DRAFT_103408 [Sporormia fimetaria CBS 119925]